MDPGKTTEKADAEVSQTEVQDRAPNNEAADLRRPRAARIDEVIAEGSGTRNRSHQITRNPSRSSRISSSIFRGRSNHGEGRPSMDEIRRAATRSREEHYRRRIASMSPGRHPNHLENVATIEEEEEDFCINPNFIDSCVNPHWVEPELPDIFTLAGPLGPDRCSSRNFVERGYADLNPEYARRADSTPLWSLAKSLPRVVRRAMIPEKPEEHTNSHRGHTHSHHHHEQEHDLESGGGASKQASTHLERIRSERERAYFSKKHGAFLNRHPGRDRDHDSTRSRNRPSGVGRISEENVPHSIHSQAVMEEDTEADIGLRRPGEDSDTAATYADDDTASSVTEIHDVDDPAYRQYNEEALHGKHLLEDNDHTHWSVIRSKYKEPLAELLAVVVSEAGKTSYTIRVHQLTAVFLDTTNLGILC